MNWLAGAMLFAAVIVGVAGVLYAAAALWRSARELARADDAHQRGELLDERGSRDEDSA